jgi:hypothetical protein
MAMTKAALTAYERPEEYQLELSCRVSLILEKVASASANMHNISTTYRYQCCYTEEPVIHA